MEADVVRRLKEIIAGCRFDNLMDYTPDFGLPDLYRDILEELLEGRVHVSADEISDGKYEITEFIGEREYGFVSKARYTGEDVFETLMSCVVEPYTASA